MKKLLTGILSLMFVVVISSCDNPNKTTDNQSVAGKESQPADSKPENTNVKPAEQTEGVQQANASSNVEITGQQIVENISNKLNDKLNLTEEQFKSLTDVLSKKFVETGGNLTTSYPIETGKKMGRDLRMKSSNEISAILNPEQKEHFEKFMNK